MTYSILQVSQKTQLAPSTLRYYDKEGILNAHRTPKGIRYFTDSDLDQLSMVCCLKSTGMSIKDIKEYFDLCALGDSTLFERMKIFTNHEEHILEEIEVLNSHLTKIQAKIKWYQGFIDSRQD